MKIILLDNFDSFTYNLVAQLQLMNHDVTVFRNNVPATKIAEHLLDEPEKRLLMLSPGPGNPTTAGCMSELINLVVGKVPIIGICLGHQALVQHFGGLVERAPMVVHGKACDIYHSFHPIFSGLSSTIKVARYHSLVATAIPPDLDIIAVSQDSLVMAIANESKKVVGFQFHPESILTIYGQKLLENTVNYLTLEQHESSMAQVAV
ncbi:aminodeoxychorismate/anthranilate synthase component II [Sessilibacter sp. MAH4]